MSISKKANDRQKAAELFEANFPSLLDKELAWQDIHRLTQDEDCEVRESVTDILGSIFSKVPDKDQAWMDLHRLTQDEDCEVRGSATYVLGSIFSQVPDKDQAWMDLHRLTQDEDCEVRGSATQVMGYVFDQVLDKDQAWQDLHRLTQDEDWAVRLNAGDTLGAVFDQVLDKDQAWQDLHSLIQDEDCEVRWSSVGALGSAFSHIPDKNQAWQDLHRLTQDKNSDVRGRAANVLGPAFSHIPDKDQAWKDLHRLTQDADHEVRYGSVGGLGSAFSQVPDKDQAWQDLHRLTQDDDREVRCGSADGLGSAFGHVPGKDQAWKDLHRLTQDNDKDVRDRAASALESAFGHAPDKNQAWQDLHRLTQDNNKDVRRSAANALGSAFSHVPDKDQAWQDLHRLTQDNSKDVRRSAANALGSAFSHVPDKDQAWQDLNRLTQDEDGDSILRMYAFHSLGRASVFKAIESTNKDALEKRLEVAVAYFEKSSHERKYSPARFCYPFYRSYYAIMFQEAKNEVIQKYLAEAKEVVGNSKTKSYLLKAIENLAGALMESKLLENRSLHEITSALNTCRLYCENAADYMAAAEVDAPGPVRLMRICNPFLKDRIESIIADIQMKARLIGPEINQAAKDISLDDPIKAHGCCMRMASSLRESCKRFSRERSDLIRSILIDVEKEMDLRIVLEKIELSMAYALPAIEEERKEILDLLRNIQFCITNLNISSGSSKKVLYEIKTNIRSVQDKMVAQELNMDDLSKDLKERDYALIERLEMMREDWITSMEKIARDLPSCEDTKWILKEVQGLKQSKRRDVLGITGDLSSIAGLFITLMGLAGTLKPA